MVTKKQGKAYAVITLDLLYKMKVKIDPETLSEQMELVYDLYEPKEAEEIYTNMLQNNRIFLNSISGRANCYVINSYNSRKKQISAIRKFCNKNIEIGKMYITPPGENKDTYYELIKDIRNKNMDILIMNIFTILGMSERELNVVIRLCRENNIIFVEV